MNINLTVRFKNPWFWISLVGVTLTAMGISPEMLTSWEALANSVIELVRNPYMLGSVVVAVLGVFIDPTTKGVNDSEQAMTYKNPK